MKKNQDAEVSSGSGFEVWKKKEVPDSEVKLLVEETRKKVLKHIQAKGLGYRGFLAVIKGLKQSATIPNVEKMIRIPEMRKKFDIIDLVYLGTRVIDDVIDGDSPRVFSYEERLQYINDRIDNIDHFSFSDKDVADMFLKEAIAIGDGMDIDIRKPLSDIIRSIAFDAQRVQKFYETGKRPLYSEEELQQYFFDLDIKGTIGGSLLLFEDGNNEKNNALLRPLGDAVRIYYNLRDLEEDIRAGLVNIPREDCERLSITSSTLDACLGKKLSDILPEVQSWIREQIQKGKYLLSQYKQKDTSHLSPLIKQILYHLYEKNSTKFFNKGEKVLGQIKK